MGTTRCKFIHSLGSKRGENMALIGFGLRGEEALPSRDWNPVMMIMNRAGIRNDARALYAM